MLTLNGKARYLASLNAQNAQIDHAVLGVHRAQEELAVAAQVYVRELQQLLARV